MGDFIGCNMEDSLEKLLIQETVKTASAHVQKFHRCVKSWLVGREYLIDMIDEIAEEIDQHYRDVHIAKATGAGVSAVGIGLTIAGFLFPPAALVGIGITVAGGVTTTGAAVTGVIIEKVKRNEILKIINEDEEKYKAAQAAMEEINVIVEHASKRVPRMSVAQIKGFIFVGSYAVQTGVQAGTFATGLARAISAGSVAAGAFDGISTAMAAGETLTAVGRFASRALVVASIPLTLASLVLSINALVKERRAPTSEGLMKLQEKLQKEYTEVNQEYENIVSLCRKICKDGSVQSSLYHVKSAF